MKFPNLMEIVFKFLITSKYKADDLHPVFLSLCYFVFFLAFKHQIAFTFSSQTMKERGSNNNNNNNPF